MPFVGGAIMPHGALILDPSRAEMAGEVGAAALRLHAACVAAGSAIAAAKPDVVLLYTPHGLLGEVQGGGWDDMLEEVQEPGGSGGASLCGECGESAGMLILCDGDCLRAFHPTCAGIPLAGRRPAPRSKPCAQARRL